MDNTATPLASRDIDDTQIIARLRLIGRGNPSAAFRRLCFVAELCPICGLSWANPDGQCACTQPERTP